MRSTRALVAVIVMSFAGAVGCGSDDGPNRGTQCGQVMQALCARLAACMVITQAEVALCTSVGTNTCCTTGGGNCGQSVVSTQADIDACVAVSSTASCTDLEMTPAVLPALCMGVVRPSALTTQTSALSSCDSSLAACAGALMSQ